MRAASAEKKVLASEQVQSPWERERWEEAVLVRG
jgi:hypothetical protein